MIKKIIGITLVASAFMLVGCGGGGSGSSGDSGTLPQVDNSPYLENQYGYFGDGVVFGSTLVVGNWTNKAMYNGVQETVMIDIYSDGEMTFTNTNNGLSFDTDYGVSQDGATISNVNTDLPQLSFMADRIHLVRIDYSGNIVEILEAYRFSAKKQE